jgi:hypothetical protein
VSVDPTCRTSRQPHKAKPQASGLNTGCLCRLCCSLTTIARLIRYAGRMAFEVLSAVRAALPVAAPGTEESAPLSVVDLVMGAAAREPVMGPL